MDLEKGITALEKFFLDVIGQVIPGGILIFGLLHLYNPSILPYYMLNIKISTATWLILLALMYSTGYVVSSLSKVTIYFANLIRKLIKKKQIDENSIADLIIGEEVYKKVIVGFGFDPANRSRAVRDARNAILSGVSFEDNYLIRRFTFIALFNVGIATSLSITLILSFIDYVLANFTNVDFGLFFFDPAIMWGMVVGIIAFCDRYFDFYVRSMRTPFSIARSKVYIEPAVGSSASP
ncbi:hypothetical protein ACMT4L_20595 [Deinococcus sp. A31D244]|uniref:hypothetical protein n=1 Tax=Deinococcus sp. A31D244 TaxID=3397675 RepID=UPI0039E135EF